LLTRTGTPLYYISDWGGSANCYLLCSVIKVREILRDITSSSLGGMNTKQNRHSPFRMAHAIFHQVWWHFLPFGICLSFNTEVRYTSSLQCLDPKTSPTVISSSQLAANHQHRPQYWTYCKVGWHPSSPWCIGVCSGLGCTLAAGTITCCW
jgi:hypothetical protein